MARPFLLRLNCPLALPAALALSCMNIIPSDAADAVPQVEPARHKAYTETIPGSKVRFDLVAVPGGIYWMGSPSGENSRNDDEGPRHLVKVRPFWMGRCEVTWDEYNLYRNEEGKSVTSEDDNDKVRARDPDAITRPTQTYPDEYRGFGKDGYPVVGISHHAAMEYCRWLSLTTGKGYRLPTEAEWEWACRAGTQSAYFFGDKSDKLAEYAWYAKNSDEETHPVGKKKPNPWGLHDIHGNVAEWCLDRYDKDSYGKFPLLWPSIGPALPPKTERFPHVVRGGSWDDPAPGCRSATRRASDESWNRQDPDNPKNLWWLWNEDSVGFRVVRAVDEQADLKGIRSRVTKKSE